MNILLINPGRRDYIIKYFLKLPKKFKIKLFLIDPDKNIASFAVSNKTKNYTSPYAKSKNYKFFLRKFVKKNKINIVFPLSEFELRILANDKKYYSEKKVCLVISNLNVIAICENKIKTETFLKNIGINCPKTISFSQIKKNLPVIKKNIFGNSSKNQKIIKNYHDIPRKKDHDYFYQKYLSFQEYGMDILNDFHGNYLHSSVRKKISMRAGDTDKAEIISSTKFLSLAKKISKRLKHIGNLDIDFLVNKKKIYVIDLNPRFGGGYPFTHEYGYNYIKALIDLYLDRKKKIKFKSKKNKITKFSKGISIYKEKR
tara:strand:+ start:10062 stop:11003 length:942 start_codon:yes stop_codon:yes gene_type:complete